MWCKLDAIGPETETILTLAFVPAFMAVVLSLLTVLRNYCGMLPCVAGQDVLLLYRAYLLL